MVTRRWTLNSNLDYYVRTGESEPRIILRLAYKERSGAVANVGTFRLDLDDLATKGVVNKRSTLTGLVFDVKIVHARDRFVLQVREGTSIALDRYSAR